MSLRISMLAWPYIAAEMGSARLYSWRCGVCAVAGRRPRWIVLTDDPPHLLAAVLETRNSCGTAGPREGVCNCWD